MLWALVALMLALSVFFEVRHARRQQPLSLSRSPSDCRPAEAMLANEVESARQTEIARLIRQSDDYLAALYPPASRHAIDLEALAAPNVRLLVARLDGVAVGWVGFALGEPGQAEIKRLFMQPAARGRGIGRALMAQLERLAAEEGVSLLQLETGVKQPEALSLPDARL